jgi:hypothetical protein
MVGAIRPEVNPQHDDGMDGAIYVERATFFDFMRPYLFDLFRQCDWALATPAPGFPNVDLTLVRD